MEPVDSIAATGLASASILAALVAELQRKGLLTDDETRAVYAQALLLLEESRGTVEDGLAHVIDMARQVIEDQL
jgi:hypothetical protein